GLIWRTAAAGALTPVRLCVLSIPSSVFAGDDPNTTAQAIIFSVALAVVAVIAVPVLVAQWMRVRRDGDGEQSTFVRLFGPVYVGVLGVLWISALPEYFGA